ncbi:hypothetical protein [Roseateles sp. PN1]|uniref:hypothetical protein n=1 Tax=Roseateles sp. PN1 TaxID=3137372 RepID=UPI003138E3E9
MTLQADLDDLLEQAKREALNVAPKDKLIDVFRANHDNWVEIVFPSWKMNGKNNCYALLAGFLRDRGFPNITDDTVSSYMKKVRDERKKSGQPTEKKILKATPVGVTPTSEPVVFNDIDRDWRAIEKLAKGATEWTPEMEEAWLHLKWIADQRKIPFQARRAMDIWAQIGGEPMKCAWLQLKLRRKDYSMNPDL